MVSKALILRDREIVEPDLGPRSPSLNVHMRRFTAFLREKKNLKGPSLNIVGAIGILIT